MLTTWYLLESRTTVDFIVADMRSLSQIFHVSANEHLTQLDKVTMTLVLN